MHQVYQWRPVVITTQNYRHAREGPPSSSANAPSLPTETGDDCDAELSSPLPSSPPSIRRVAAALPLGSVRFCSSQQRLPPCGHCTVVDELVLATHNGDETTIRKLATFINCLGSNGRSALHVISSEGCPTGARIPIHNGADIAALTARYKPPATSTPGCFGETPLHLSLCAAGTAGHVRYSSRSALR